MELKEKLSEVSNLIAEIEISAKGKDSFNERPSSPQVKDVSFSEFVQMDKFLIKIFDYLTFYLKNNKNTLAKPGKMNKVSKTLRLIADIIDLWWG